MQLLGSRNPPHLAVQGPETTSVSHHARPMFSILINKVGWLRWLTTVIPASREAQAGRSPEVGSSRPSGPTWRNPDSTQRKKKKLAGHHGSHLESQPLGRLRKMNYPNPRGGGHSGPRPCQCIPAWATRAKFCPKKKKRETSFTTLPRPVCNSYAAFIHRAQLSKVLGSQA